MNPFPTERPEQLNVITEWLINATGAVGRDYFQLPVAESEEPIYRERVYCYELYHQWRSQWTDNCFFSLGGEIDKGRHPLIRTHDKPDFLVHIPGYMDNNLLIVEVKPANAGIEQMANDLKKLVWFRGNPANYHAAYLLIYGLPIADWVTLKESLLNELTEGESTAVRENVICIIHEHAGDRAQIMSWEN